MADPTLEEIDAEIERRQRLQMREAALSNGTGRLTVEDIDAEIARRTQEQQQEQRQPQAARTALTRAAERSVSRSASPMGLGWITQPLVNTALDPARRREVGRSIQGAWRSAQEIPNLDFGRLARDTAQNVGEGAQGAWNAVTQDPLGTAGRVLGAIPQVVGEATVSPIMREEEAQRQLDYQRALGGDTSAPARQANAATGQTAINVAAPLALGGAPSALRAAGVAAAASAPSALSGEGSLQERLPRAIPQIGVAAGLGAGLQSLASAAPRALSVPSRTVQRAQQFEDAGVRPMLAATHGRTGAPMTMAIAENPIGGNVRRNMQRSVDSVRDSAQRIGGRYGQRGQPEHAGEVAQQAVRRFSRDTAPPPSSARPEAISTQEWSFNAKANALYDRVFENIARDEAGHIQGMTGASATADNARRVLQEMDSAITAPNVRQIVQAPLLQQIRSALEADQHVLRFNDLRRLRTWVREAQRDQGLRQGIDSASLQRLEGALTQDIMTSAEALGGRVLAGKLRRVDQFYRAGQERIQRALEPFGQGGGRQAYDRILSLAREGGRQNSQALVSLKRSLRPDEWREIAATVIDDMGRPSPGNVAALEEGAFSIERFVTEYAKLSTDGRRALFGSLGGGRGADSLAASLDNLAQVAGYLKQVRGFTNYSRSGSSMQNVGTLGTLGGASAAAFMGHPEALGAVLAAAGLTRFTGEVLTNPRFVRWLTSAAKAGQTPGGMRGSLRALSQLAGRDPAVAALLAEQSQRAPDAAGDPASTPRQTEPMTR